MNYDDWNRALAETFFNPNQEQKPVYLHVDDELLQDIALQHGLNQGTGRECFVQAVITRARFSENKTQPFFKFLQWRAWENQLRQDPTTPPPFVGFLGFCVLAAVDMTADEKLNVTSGNYYVRLNKLLRLSGRGQPTGFEEIESAWERLNQWLKDDLQGKFGLPTANNRLYGRHVGYPISQALMRRTDFEELPRFFHWCGPDSGEENVTADYFKQQLQHWANLTTCSFSQQLKHMLVRNQQHVTAIAEMTLAYYRAWDGDLVTIKGERRAEIVVQLIRAGRSFELALHPKAPDDFPEERYGRAFLRRTGDAHWFEPLDAHFLQQWLRGEDLDLQHKQYRLMLPARRIIPLRSDITSDLGGWIACGRVSLGEKHMVLCHQTQQEAVAAYLATYGAGGERLLGSREPVYAQWVCFDNIRINRTSLDDWGELDCLVPLPQAGIRLSGGLKLKQGVWLQGGEPEVIITAESEMPVFLDDQQVATAVLGSTLLDLREYHLVEGTHVIRVGAQGRTIAIAYPGSELLGPQRMQLWGYPLQRQDETQYRPLSLAAVLIPSPETIPTGQLYVAGTHILHSPMDPPPVRQHLLILPYGARRYIILGRQIGDVFEPELPTYLPQWQAEDYLRGYKQIVPFTPQWLITVSHRNNLSLRPLGHPEAPKDSISRPEMAEKWRQWAGKRTLIRRLPQHHQNRWLQYIKVAQGKR
ncbi:MAG: hypothetical protein KJ069_16070 [Anaerolineae bacterium]|nr:hypothetical protein [Anaerolineae bacterium]